MPDAAATAAQVVGEMGLQTENADSPPQHVTQTPGGTPPAATPPVEAAPTPQGLDLLRQQLGVTKEQAPDDLLIRHSQEALSQHMTLKQKVADLESRLQQAPMAPVAPAATPAKPQSFWDQTPEWQPEWATLVEMDAATNTYKARAGVDPRIAASANARQTWMQQAAQRLFSNPRQEILSIIGPELESLIQKKAEEKLGAFSQDQGMGSFVRENFDWLVQKDSGGRPMRDLNGQPVPSAAGDAFFKMTQYLESQGVTDWKARSNIASLVVNPLRQPQAPLEQRPPPHPVVAASQGRVPAQTTTAAQAAESIQGQSTREILGNRFDFQDGEDAGQWAARIFK